MNKFLKILGITFGILTVLSLTIWIFIPNPGADNQDEVRPIFKTIEDKIEAFISRNGGEALDVFELRYSALLLDLQEDTVSNNLHSLTVDLHFHYGEQLKEAMKFYCKNTPFDRQSFKELVEKVRALKGQLENEVERQEEAKSLIQQMEVVLFQSMDKTRKARHLNDHIEEIQSIPFSQTRYEKGMKTIEEVMNAEYVSQNRKMRKTMQYCENQLNKWKDEASWFQVKSNYNFKEILTRDCDNITNSFYQRRCPTFKEEVFARFLGVTASSDLNALKRKGDDACNVLGPDEKKKIIELNCRDIQSKDRRKDDYFLLCRDIQKLPCLTQ